MWTTSLESYDYLRNLSARDWAWEALRRNPKYETDFRSFSRPDSKKLGGGALITPMQEALPPAEAWALCCFR
jgi:Family of unknown function (DUF6499)